MIYLNVPFYNNVGRCLDFLEFALCFYEKLNKFMFYTSQKKFIKIILQSL